MNGLNVCFVGLTVSSSWGNGHATTYRGLLRELAALGHHVTFLERDVPWYARHRDCPNPEGCELHLYGSLADLERRFEGLVRQADLVVVGSYVPQGCEVIRWVQRTATGPTAFYDIDTPVTLAKLDRGDEEYLSVPLIAGFDAYLSFTGGPTLDRLERDYGARRAEPLYCSVDPRKYYPEEAETRWDLGYLGTYSPDRQPALDRLLVQVAARRPRARFAVAGPSYPADLAWPDNVTRTDHVAPGEHRAFYRAQRFTLNVTRADMVRAGWSPSVRLFEAAACGVPIVSDVWPGIEDFFTPGQEILLARTTADAERFVFELPEAERRAVAERARARVLTHHTAAARARELEAIALDLLGGARAAAQPRSAVSR